MTSATSDSTGQRTQRAPVTVVAPAKVNLQLSVGPPAVDGYHPLATIFQAVSLYDEITVTARERGAGVSLTVDGDTRGDVPVGPENLAWRAVNALADEADRLPDVHVHIRKGIPVAGGMAGGSADAAATLLACAALWGESATRDDLAGVAARLGSDVPFILYGGTAVGTGRGDQLTPALNRGQFHWVFALAHDGLSTPAVYRRFDQLTPEAAQPEVDEAVMRALRSGDAPALGRALSNDLQRAALDLRPALRSVMEAGEENEVLGSVVSGSGPTVALLVADEEAALDLTVQLSSSGLCRAVRHATGPVPGARIVHR